MILCDNLPKRSLVETISRAGHALSTVTTDDVLKASLSDRGHDSDLHLFTGGVRGDKLGESYDTNGVRNE